MPTTQKKLVKSKKTAKPAHIEWPVVKKKAKPKVKRRVLTPTVTNPYPPPLKNWKRPIRCLLNRYGDECGVNVDVDSNAIRLLAAFVEDLLKDLGASQTNRAGFARIVTVCKEFFPTLAGAGLDTRGFLERLQTPDFGGFVLVKEDPESFVTDGDSSRDSESSCSLSEDATRMLKDAQIRKLVMRSDNRYYQR
ncbi:MAG: hypothetical protein KVP17_000312 [Porospora cf. gigantea B]|uniref:uncharacterized protein n=1 Tax=Porospora cf. gigantea B TaxID=2853592 RepID=UPI003571D166|nr:MAG: hypothetical protein KVP17_000312 [Porospora cf. gigantea B]